MTISQRAIIIHCWGGTPEYCWYPWAKRQLEALGYVVQLPAMPHTDQPQLTEWLPTLQQLIGQPDDELVLIGHSLGTVTIMRYLEAIPPGQQIGKALLVAGFTDQLGFRELENFFETKLDYPKIKAVSSRGFTIIQSDNDPYVSRQYGQRLKSELGVELVVKHAAGHMSHDDGCTELPELLAAI